jgi:ABC-2 type transport system ATP-binding protein
VEDQSNHDFLGEVMLEAIELSKQYGDHRALDGLNLKIESGEVYCLLGSNGAGKTTTINLFLNFIEPTSGRALVAGVDVANSPIEARRHLAYIPEQVGLYGQLSGFENLEYFTKLSGDAQSDDLALRSYLVRVGLAEDALDKPTSTYSKGMRQKVGIAFALSKGAKALFLDEPTSGLDPSASNEFSELIASMAADGCAVLMATHDLFRVKESGTRVGIMTKGRLVEEMLTSDVGHADLEKIYLKHMRF